MKISSDEADVMHDTLVLKIMDCLRGYPDSTKDAALAEALAMLLASYDLDDKHTENLLRLHSKFVLSVVADIRGENDEAA